MSCAAAAPPAFLLSVMFQVDSKYTDMLGNALFVCQIREYLVDDMLVGTYRDLVASKLGIALGYMSTTFMTIWVMYHGFMIISGANRQPILALGFQTAKMVLILSVVAMVAGHSPAIAETVLDFQALISAAIVGEGTDIYRTIDLNVGLALVFNAIIDGLVGGQQANADGKSLTTIAGLVGQSGPAMVVSAYALAAEVFITLAIMLAPVFIFFLLFQQTAGKFWSWVRYLLGTMFSLAVMVLISSVLLKMMMMYGAGVIAAFFINGSALGSYVTFDIGGSAMRMAMMGGLSSALLLMIPPVIMGFFNSGASFAANALAGAIGGGSAASLVKAMQGDGASGASGADGTPGAPGSNALGHSGGGAPEAGSSALNRQIHQSIASRGSTSAGDGGGANGGVGGARALNAGSRGNAAAENPSAKAAQQVERNLASSGELRPNPKTGVYETANTPQHMRDSAMGKGGHIPVSGAPSSAGSSSNASAAGGTTPRSATVEGSVGGTTVAQDGSAALSRSGGNGALPAPPVPPSRADASTSVHARPPPGVAQTVPPSGRSNVVDVAAREVRNPAAARPKMPERR